jgi:hypothetical protein
LTSALTLASSVSTLITAVYDIFRENRGYLCTKCRLYFDPLWRFTRHIHICCPRAKHLQPEVLPPSWQLLSGQTPPVEDEPVLAPVQKTRTGRQIQPPSRFANGEFQPIKMGPPPAPRPYRRRQAPAASDARRSSSPASLKEVEVVPPATKRRRAGQLPPSVTPAASPHPPSIPALAAEHAAASPKISAEHSPFSGQMKAEDGASSSPAASAGSAAITGDAPSPIERALALPLERALDPPETSTQSVASSLPTLPSGSTSLDLESTVRCDSLAESVGESKALLAQLLPKSGSITKEELLDVKLDVVESMDDYRRLVCAVCSARCETFTELDDHRVEKHAFERLLLDGHSALALRMTAA